MDFYTFLQESLSTHIYPEAYGCVKSEGRFFDSLSRRVAECRFIQTINDLLFNKFLSKRINCDHKTLSKKLTRRKISVVPVTDNKECLTI